MTAIDVFYQGEGVPGIGFIEVERECTFSAVKALLIEKHGCAADILIFLEDADEPVDELLILGHHASSTGVKAHVHRCRRVEVDVTFNGTTVHHHFSPGTTIAKVKRWATEKFEMGAEDAGEHVLQIGGTHERPTPGTHLGALVSCPHCRITFDLVPDQRVNGYSSGSAI